MADGTRRHRDTALGVVGAVTLGAVAASMGAPAALADEPVYPSWADVQRAKADQAAAAGEATRITGLLGELQDRADAAGRVAAIAAERFHRARLAEDAARERHTGLAAQADAAQRVARTSRMRAGLLAASAARGGGQLELMLDGTGADDLLHRLATVSQLSAQSQAIYARALADERQAAAVGDQADVAAAALTDRAEEAQEALGAAQRAVATATDAVATEQRHEQRLLSQLADLRGTSVRVAARYVAGIRADAGAAAPDDAVPAPDAPDPAPSPAAPAPAPAATTPDPAGAASTAPARPTSAPVRPSAAPSRAPEPVEPSQPPRAAPAPAAGPPNSAQAASAVAFARDQIGDEYRFGGAGPSSWDCSGLTSAAYASVGLAIGGHSATAQYRLAAAQGRLVPYAQVLAGDLIFYTDGGGDMYHVAIYSGSGLMIEAPYPGVKVREVPVRSGDRVAQVARPTA